MSAPQLHDPAELRAIGAAAAEEAQAAAGDVASAAGDLIRAWTRNMDAANRALEAEGRLRRMGQTDVFGAVAVSEHNITELALRQTGDSAETKGRVFVQRAVPLGFHTGPAQR